MLEAWVYCTCFPFRTELAGERNIPCQSMFPSGRNIHFKENNSVMLNQRDTCKSWKNSMEVRSLRNLNNVCLWELDVNFKRILPTYQCFQVGKSFALWKIGLYCWIRDTGVSPGWISCMREDGVSCALFPFAYWVSMWKEYFLSVRVVKWEKHFFYGK
jgi:hypothetical protein